MIDELVSEVIERVFTSIASRFDIYVFDFFDFVFKVIYCHVHNYVHVHFDLLIMS